MYNSDIFWVEFISSILDVVPATLWMVGLLGYTKRKSKIPCWFLFGLTYVTWKLIDESMAAWPQILGPIDEVYHPFVRMIFFVFFWGLLFVQLNAKWDKRLLTLTVIELPGSIVYFCRSGGMYLLGKSGLYSVIEESEVLVFFVRLLLEWIPHFTLYYLFRKWVWKYRESEIKNKILCWTINGLMIALQLSSVLVYTINGIGYRGKYVFLAMPLIILLLILYRMMFLKNENIKMYLQKQLMEAHYEVIQGQVEWTRKMSHDMYNHINLLKTLDLKDQEQKNTYMKELMECFRAIEHIDYCGNVMIDSVLHHKMIEAKNNGISIHTEIQDLKTGMISDADLFGVFYTVLEIGMGSGRENDDLEMAAKNIAGQISLEMKGIRKATDKDARLKMKALRKLVKNLDGSMKVEWGDEMGYLMLSIPCEN